MEQIGQQDALYDFLYKDVNRLASYYAQIFKGKLSSLEKVVTERHNVDVSGKLDLHVVSGDRKITSEASDSDKRIIDPHDLITVDVLSFLMSSGFVSDNVAEAVHGSLIVAQGTLLFVDRLMAEMAMLAFDQLINTELSKPKSQQDKFQVQNLKTLKEALSKLTLPSAFVLQMSEDVLVAGIIKEAGMEEPILGYYFKHGAAGLSSVYLVGIKEVPAPIPPLANADLLGAGQQMAEALSGLLFPQEAIRVTPLALFRKLF